MKYLDSQHHRSRGTLDKTADGRYNRRTEWQSLDLVKKQGRATSEVLVKDYDELLSTGAKD